MGSDEAVIPVKAAAIAAAVRSGALAPDLAVADALRRIEARDDGIRAFVSVRPEAALAEARALADRPDLSELALAGVPLAVKDSLDVAGELTGHGTRAVTPRAADSDTEVVRRLRLAGAVVVGKATLPELGIWATTDGHFGVTRNPRAKHRTAGGSSGGCAAAVAAGMVPLAVGTDGLGSVRIPAAACGIAGFKFGSGVVPTDPGFDWRGMTGPGPLATTAGDVALAAAVMADRPALNEPAMHGALVVAVSTRSPLPGGAVAPAWAEATVEAGGRLRDRGHRVLAADPPYSSLLTLPVFSRWFGGVADMVEALESDPGLDRRGLEPRTRRHAFLGRTFGAIGWHRLAKRWRDEVDRFFGTYDVLLTPGLAHPPIAAREWAGRGWLRNVASNSRYAPFAAAWNLAGVPAGVVPWSDGRDGTVTAVQVIAPRGRERLVLTVMQLLERDARFSAGPVPQTF